MDIVALAKGLDRGFYRELEARRKSDDFLTSYAFLHALALKEGIAPSDAERQAREKRFLARFGVRDEGSHLAARVRAYAEKTWTLDHALESLGIRTRGPESHTCDKFFTTTTSTVLFPTFVESQVVAGILLMSLVPHLIAQEVGVASHNAEHLAMDESQAQRRTTASGEGARGALVQIKTADRSVKLNKFQAELQCSYESLRLQRLNVVSLFLQRLGEQIGIDETDDLLEVLVNGDGNAGSAATVTEAEVSGTLDYDELVRLFLAFPKGYEMRAAVLNDTYLRSILNLSEFKDAEAGFSFQRTGMIPNPVGAGWHRWTSTGSAGFGTTRILAVDSRLAATQYTEGGLLTESDRLIDRQFERTVISKWTGFGKLDYQATQLLDVAP